MKKNIHNQFDLSFEPIKTSGSINSSFKYFYVRDEKLFDDFFNTHILTNEAMCL